MSAIVYDVGNGKRFSAALWQNATRSRSRRGRTESYSRGKKSCSKAICASARDVVGMEIVVLTLLLLEGKPRWKGGKHERARLVYGSGRRECAQRWHTPPPEAKGHKKAGAGTARKGGPGSFLPPLRSLGEHSTQLGSSYKAQVTEGGSGSPAVTCFYGCASRRPEVLGRIRWDVGSCTPGAHACWNGSVDPAILLATAL